jgi:hypothetical protein
LPTLVAKAEEHAAKTDESVADELVILLDETFDSLLYSDWAADYFPDVCFGDFDQLGKEDRLEPRHLFIPMVNEAIARIDFRQLAEMVLAA